MTEHVRVTATTPSIKAAMKKYRAAQRALAKARKELDEGASHIIGRPVTLTYNRPDDEWIMTDKR